jgi:hypothetical protein
MVSRGNSVLSSVWFTGIFISVVQSYPTWSPNWLPTHLPELSRRVNRRSSRSPNRNLRAPFCKEICYSCSYSFSSSHLRFLEEESPPTRLLLARGGFQSFSYLAPPHSPEVHSPTSHFAIRTPINLQVGERVGGGQAVGYVSDTIVLRGGWMIIRSIILSTGNVFTYVFLSTSV